MEAQDPALQRLVEQVKHATAHQQALDIRGGGTKRFYGESPRGEALEVGALSGITSYEPTELVVTVRAGTPLSDLEAELAQSGQSLPFEPPRFADGGTVGGMVAAGLSGPARASAGSVRDHVLGLSLLNGRGEILSFGGQVTKNVAGYDVSRLVAGSLGILGVICEVSLKVLPKSIATSTLCFDWPEQKTLQQFGTWASRPLPITATAWHENQLWVRLAGARAAVIAASNTLGGTAMPAEQAADFWSSVRDQRGSFFAVHEDSQAGREPLWRLSVAATSPPIVLPGRQFIEWNGAQRWWRTHADAALVRTLAAKAGGHATLMRGADKSSGAFAPLNDVLMRIHEGLKLAFDPARIFNPGRLYAGL
jgi:glycolate oxidase FAD binding subunit